MATLARVALRVLSRARQRTVTADQAARMPYDYVVVGAGSAGCALAARLSEDPTKRVLLLEAGGKDINPWIHIPVGYFRTMHSPDTDWCFKTDGASSGLAGRSISWPRGKVLGGCSSINGLLAVHGQREDYDGWADPAGRWRLAGWGYDDCMPHFDRLQSLFNDGEDVARSAPAPITLESGERAKRTVVDAFLRGCEELGAPLRSDVGPNSRAEASQLGAGYFYTTTRHSMRCSSAVGYLDPLVGRGARPNLDIVTGAHARRVLLEDERGGGEHACRATGLEFSVQGEPHTARLAVAGGEVLLSAGAIGSPHILQLSGIGEAAHVRGLGLEGGLRHELPGVGHNLLDHLQIRHVYKTKGCATLNDDLSSWPRKVAKGIEYFLFGTGPLSMAASLGCAFLKTEPQLARPDVQIHFQPLSATSFKVGGASLDPFSAVTASVCQLRPRSTGSVLAQSADPAQPPLISPNYLSHEEDKRTVVRAMRLVRAVMRDSRAMLPYTHSELVPGPEVPDHSDEELLAHARKIGESIYHPAGTCRMGRADDEGAVVDESLRVHGIAGLRVVDASVMPELVSGNTNLPTIMLAEKIAHEMKSEPSSHL